MVTWCMVLCKDTGHSSGKMAPTTLVSLLITLKQGRGHSSTLMETYLPEIGWMRRKQGRANTCFLKEVNIAVGFLLVPRRETESLTFFTQMMSGNTSRVSI